MSGFIKKSLAYYAGARERAGRRASRWNALLIPLSLGAWAGIWYFGFKLVWVFHSLSMAIIPTIFMNSDFWPRLQSVRRVFHPVNVVFF